MRATESLVWVYYREASASGFERRRTASWSRAGRRPTAPARKSRCGQRPNAAMSEGYTTARRAMSLMIPASSCVRDHIGQRLVGRST